MTHMLPWRHIPRSWLIAGLLCCAGFAPATDAFSVSPFIASNELPSKATNPVPADGATNVSVTPILSWTNDGSATSYDVYCNGQFMGNQTAIACRLGTLSFDTTYSWRIDARNTNGVTTGDTWSFTTAQATNYAGIFSFGSVTNDGARLYAGLTLVGSNLYGTTCYGGSFSNGTIFAILANGSGYTNLHNFGSVAHDGAIPYAGLTRIGSTLYGTTSSGGSKTNGIVFAINLDGTGYTNLHNFGSVAHDGAWPYAGLTQVDSTLYGATAGGGSSIKGILFSIHTNGSGYAILHNFGSSANDGAYPYSALTAVGTNLYGTTYGGGSFNKGVIFSVHTNGTGYANLYNFGSMTNDGAFSYAYLTPIGSTLYGTTVSGGSFSNGTIFAIRANGASYTNLYNFGSVTNDGTKPYAGLASVGSMLFGTTPYGGSLGYGTLFGINADGVGYTNLHNFGSVVYDGLFPFAGLTLVGSMLDGTTWNGGSFGAGAIFTLPVTGAMQLSNITAPASPVDGGAISGSGLYPVGTNAQLQATAHNGWLFTGWSDGATNNLRIFTVPATNVTYTADFLFECACRTNADNTITLAGYTGPDGDVTLPAAINGRPVTGIGRNAFASSDLTSVTIPASVTNISENAFEDCTNLTAVYFQGNAPTLVSSAFAGDINATAYRFVGTTGWPTSPALFGGLPLVVLPSPIMRTFTVSSAHGGAYPGTISTNAFSNVTEWIDASLVVNGATQYVLTGVTVKGNAFTQASPTNVTLTLTNNATLTWNWQTQVLLTTATNGPGSVTPGGWYIAGSNAVLTATPAANMHLLGWAGDTNGCKIAGNTLTAPMTQARAITAWFVRETLTVVSDHGGTLPGTTGTTSGAAINAWVTNSPVINGTTQYLCTGATVKGNAFTQVSPTNVTLTLTNNATLTWLWSTDYWLAIVTNGAGSVNPPSGWWPKGSNAQIIATAGDHARFGSWSGQTSGCTIKSNVITAPMTSVRSITANFVGQGTVVVVASPPDGGTVTGGGTYDTNATVTLTAKATNANWKFQGWADTNSAASPRSIRASVGGATYTANFTMLTGEISLSTNALAFGKVPVGQSVTQTVTVSNIGSSNLTVSSITVPTGYTAKPTVFTLKANGSTNVAIAFAPTLAAAQTGTVTLVSNAARGASKVAVTGTGVVATRVVQLIGPLNFGLVRTNTTSNLTVTVADNGNSPMTVTALAFGTGGTMFKLPGLKVPFTVAAGGSTNLTVTYTPTAVGTNRATLTATVTSMTAGSTNTITATGSAFAAMPLTIKATAFAASVGAGSGALVVRVVELTLPPHVPATWELASVVVAGGKAQVVPTLLAADGTVCTLALECYGTDANHDGIPDAMAAVLGERLTEGMKLLTIQYADGTITAITPFADILVVEGIPMPLDALPATWQLAPAGK